MTDPEIDASGTKYWYNERHKCHRLDGPAVEYANGTKLWYVNDQLHRTDGRKRWFIQDRELTEAEHLLLSFVTV